MLVTVEIYQENGRFLKYFKMKTLGNDTVCTKPKPSAFAISLVFLTVCFGPVLACTTSQAVLNRFRSSSVSRFLDLFDSQSMYCKLDCDVIISLRQSLDSL